jgi:hypothetical protein
MSEIGGKFRQVPFDIDAAAMPLGQCVDGQSMPKVQQTRSA